jgi:membrane-associated phospholipid phosphatase
MARISIISVLLLLLPLSIYSQNGTVDNFVPLLSLVKQTPQDILFILTSPLRCEKDDAYSLLFYASLTACLVGSGDQVISSELIRGKNNFPLGLPNVASRLGEIYDSRQLLWVGAVSATLAGSTIFHQQKLLETTFLMAESFAISSCITVTGKHLLARSKPYAGSGPHDFRPFTLKTNDAIESMPSGHTSSIFSLMTVLAKQYDHWWVKMPAYTFAAGVALQRIYDKKHWPSDVLVGGLIGYSTATLLVNRHNKKNTTSAIRPFLGANKVGLLIKF